MKDDAEGYTVNFGTCLPYFPLVVPEDAGIFHVCALNVLVVQDFGLPNGGALQYLGHRARRKGKPPNADQKATSPGNRG